MTKKQHSREYLEEALGEAKKLLPGWAFAMVHQAALPRAGGRVSARQDQPTPLEKVALQDIRPGTLEKLSEEELRLAWLRLNQWFTAFTRRRQPIEDVVNAALWAIEEFGRRNIEVAPSELSRAVAELRRLRDDAGIHAKLEKLPRDLMVVRDFVNLVGSAAKGKENPGDLDLLIRAPETQGGVVVQTDNVWLPIRNVLDPEKKDLLSFLFNAQGAHGDHVPMFDLVLRRKDEMRTTVVKGELPLSPRGLTAGETLDEVARRSEKFSQAEAAYAEPSGDPSRLCGTCRFFQRVPGEAERGLCQVVEGAVAWFGVSELFISAEEEARAILGQPKEAPREPENDDAEPLRKTDDRVVPAVGPKGAPVAFIGASPDRVDGARTEPFVGAAGETLNELYVKPLGLRRDQVVLANAVPLVLANAQGNAREPKPLELAEWRPKLMAELDRLKPGLVVALGNKAKRALGDRADAFMPHPSAVRRFGNSGEVTRKIRQLKRRLGQTVEKQIGDEGADPQAPKGDTQGARAQRNWAANWHKFLPTSGKGKFVYHHHWRGLETDRSGVDETKLSDAQLLKTNNSLHGDLRLEGEDGLFGWAVLIGRAPDNARLKHGDKLLSGKSELRLAPKLQQPREWLEFGGGQGSVVKPGGPGATAGSHAKFFIRDQGTYRLGVAQRNSVELVLDGKHLNGRYLITFPELEPGSRVWLIDKPKDQTPRAERENLADVSGELKRKGRKFLFWGTPGEKPQKLDVRTGKVTKSLVVPIAKADEEKQIIYAVVLDPYGESGSEEDAHNEWVPPSEVEKTAHEWFEKSRVVSLNHRGPADAQPVESWVEQYLPGEYRKAMRGESHRVLKRKFGNQWIHSGAWILGTRLNDKLWADYKSGKIQAYSIEGFGFRTPASKRVMPDVKFIELTAANA